jgi:hypothetical protein
MRHLKSYGVDYEMAFDSSANFFEFSCNTMNFSSF